MSLPYNLGNFTSRQDEINKKREFFKLLDEQTEINYETEKAQDEFENVLKRGALQVPISLEPSKLRMKQQQAISFLSELMPSFQAQSLVMSYFPRETELDFFLSHFNAFKRGLPLETQLSPSNFKTLWYSFSRSKASPAITIPKSDPIAPLDKNMLIVKVDTLERMGVLDADKANQVRKSISDATRQELVAFDRELMKIENRVFS